MKKQQKEKKKIGRSAILQLYNFYICKQEKKKRRSKQGEGDVQFISYCCFLSSNRFSILVPFFFFCLHPLFRCIHLLVQHQIIRQSVIVLFYFLFNVLQEIPAYMRSLSSFDVEKDACNQRRGE